MRGIGKNLISKIYEEINKNGEKRGTITVCSTCNA